jgi:hypothetical protein
MMLRSQIEAFEELMEKFEEDGEQTTELGKPMEISIPVQSVPNRMARLPTIKESVTETAHETIPIRLSETSMIASSRSSFVPTAQPLMI